MTALKGTNVAAQVIPFDSADTYPTHDSIYGMGGYREVADVTARDAIPATRLREGALCYVQSVDIIYEWDGAAWSAFPTIFLDSITNVVGSMLWRSPSGWAQVSPSGATAGYVLTYTSSTTVPTWQAGGGGGGGGGYPPGTPPALVQVAHNVSGAAGAVFSIAPTNGNLLVAMSFNPAVNGAGSGWTKQTENSSGTDYGLIFTKVAGAGESTTQSPLSGAPGTGAMVIWELSGQAAGFFVSGASQAEQSGIANNVAVILPNVENCIGLSAVGGTGAISATFNAGTQDVLDSSGGRSLAAGHTDLSKGPVAGIMTLSGSTLSTKGCTCLITS